MEKLAKRVGSNVVVLSDFYTMGSEALGSGAYGSVKTCTQKSSGVEMAVKMVDKVRVSNRLPSDYCN